MGLYDDLLQSIRDEDCPVRRVVIGLHWTVVESRFAGVALTLAPGGPDEVEDAGRLTGRSALTLARRLVSPNPLESSLGLAAFNSLIGPGGEDGDANSRILAMSGNRSVVVVGRFPLVADLRRTARVVHCLEIEPLPGELPAAAAEEVIPAADIVVLTASALINKTMPRLLELSRGKRCFVLGPSTPMNEVLLDHGAEVLEGVRLGDPESFATCIGQGVRRFRHLLDARTTLLSRGRG